jgi:alkylation response protein AidB-like acyl-CoA dehydrogenase
MDLALSDEQELLVKSYSTLLREQSSSERVRAVEPLGYDPALWAALSQLGPVQMAVPEADGGWGADMLDLCLLSECVGRWCAAVPLIEAQVAARLLARLGATEALEAALDGGQKATLALHEPTGGLARLVPAGAVSERVLVRRGDTVCTVANSPAAIHVANHADLPLADVPVERAEQLAAGPSALAAYETAIDEWLLLTAGALVGLASGALSLATEYAKTREAFGVPIGSFQGIAHPLAGVATAIDGARLLVHEAAWSVDTAHAEAAERCALAFGFASEVARDATYWGVHTLGGYGVMVEYDAQLFFRRARGWAGVFGNADEAYRRAADHRYGRVQVTR